MLSAHYRTTDPVANLLLRLTIRRRAGAGMAPYDGLLDADSLPAERLRELEEVSREYHWQQKEFSPAEALMYLRALRAQEAGEGVGDLTGPLHQQYLEAFRRRLAQQPVEELLHVPDNGVLLYTITDRDMALPKEVRSAAAAAAPLSRKALPTPHSHLSHACALPPTLAPYTAGGDG
jgi:hypothetical protein